MSELISIYDKHQDAQLRSHMQQRWVAKHRLPLITLTTYLPQSMVLTSTERKIFRLATEAAFSEIKKLGGTVVEEETFQRKSGCEAMYVVSGLSAREIKKCLIKLENQHDLGSFFNFDVMTSDGKTISRKSCQLEARKCIICQQAASYCAAYYKHSESQLEQKARAMLTAYFDVKSETKSETENETESETV